MFDLRAVQLERDHMKRGDRGAQELDAQGLHGFAIGDLGSVADRVDGEYVGRASAPGDDCHREHEK
jgi:hypothetical protein